MRKVLHTECEPMSYKILDLEHGDVLAIYDSLDVARQRLVEFLDGSPERGDEMAIAAVDASGTLSATCCLAAR